MRLLIKQKAEKQGISVSEKEIKNSNFGENTTIKINGSLKHFMKKEKPNGLNI